MTMPLEEWLTGAYAFVICREVWTDDVVLRAHVAMKRPCTQLLIELRTHERCMYGWCSLDRAGTVVTIHETKLRFQGGLCVPAYDVLFSNTAFLQHVHEALKKAFPKLAHTRFLPLCSRGTVQAFMENGADLRDVWRRRTAVASIQRAWSHFKRRRLLMAVLRSWSQRALRPGGAAYRSAERRFTSRSTM